VARRAIRARDRKRFVHLAPSFVHLAPSFVHLAPSFVHLAPSFVHLAPSFVHLALSFVQGAGSFVRQAQCFVYSSSCLVPGLVRVVHPDSWLRGKWGKLCASDSSLRAPQRGSSRSSAVFGKSPESDLPVETAAAPSERGLLQLHSVAVI
jgi:hypothetical protein